MFERDARLPIGDLEMEIGAHVGQRRPEAGGRGFEARESGGASNAGRADDGAGRIDDGDLVGNVPDRRTLGLFDPFEPMDNAVTGQNLFIVVSELIGQERRGDVVVSLAENTVHRDKLIPPRVIERVLNEEGTIDPEVTALAILHPREHVGKTIQQLGEMRGDHRDNNHRRMLSIIVGKAALNGFDRRGRRLT